jgi:TetR/AcrR family transcriptional repressor of nem operon
MARTREFDETAVLEKALDLFWRQGYEATSVRDLTAALGISSSSLYAAFGDKRAVYLQALAHYRVGELEAVREQLAGDEAALLVLRRFLSTVIEALLADTERGGSFTLNAAVELGPHDADVLAQLNEHLMDLSDLLASYLYGAQGRGEVSDRFAPDDLARYLLHNLYSLGTMATVMPNRYQLGRLAAIILAPLESDSRSRA